jgi:DNA-binding NarL/FixJ family response regulator
VTNTIRIAVRGQVRLLVESLERLLASESPFLVVDGDVDPPPDVLLFEAAALGPIEDLRRAAARSRVLVIGADDDPEWAVKALRAGSRGILEKGASLRELAKAVQVIHEGQIWARQHVVARLVEDAARGPREALSPASPTRELSAREHEVASSTVEGLSNKEIAARLAISEATVKAHLTSIFRKLGVRGRGQLQALYHRAAHLTRWVPVASDRPQSPSPRV